jgi:hypothetical protein
MGTEINLPAIQFDGADDNDRLIKGAILKNIDGRWSAKDGTILQDGELFLGLGTTEAVQGWQNNMPRDVIMKQPGESLPDVDQLNEQIPQTDWEKGLNGLPRPPWQHVWVVYLMRLSDGTMFTFLNSTTGARIAVQRLASSVRNMRVLRGANVVPILRLTAKPMKTQFGEKMRPDFEVVKWHELSDAGGALPDKGPTPQIENKPSSKVGKPVKPVTTAEEMDDEIPF